MVTPINIDKRPKIIIIQPTAKVFNLRLYKEKTTLNKAYKLA
jgi:hypothetical protein